MKGWPLFEITYTIMAVAAAGFFAYLYYTDALRQVADPPAYYYDAYTGVCWAELGDTGPRLVECNTHIIEKAERL